MYYVMKNNSIQNNPDIQFSKYNEAAQQVSRLHESWVIIKSLRRKGKLVDWNFELDDIFCELSGDRNWKPEYEKSFYNFMPLYVEAKKQGQAALYQLLLKKHIFLKQLQDKLGKGGAYKEKDDSGMNG